MPTIQVPAQLTVEHLLEAVKQLSPTELNQFIRQFEAWQEHNGQPMEDEAALVAGIKKNSRLPVAQQRRFNHLRRKRQNEKLTKSEQGELQALWQRVEQMNVARLEALTKLAQRRGIDVRTLMRQLGLPENRDVF
jgi:hypothetical protein